MISFLNVFEVRPYQGRDRDGVLSRLEVFLEREGPVPLSLYPGMLGALERGLRHIPHCLVALEGERVLGFLALAYVRSLTFGRFLVGLPYVNSGGVVADDDDIARRLIDHAVELADHLRVRYLELRHEQPVEHPALVSRMTGKVLMRLALPATVEELWGRLASKVRSQVRKGQKNGLTVAWGGSDLLPDFYSVFSQNMRDLGTPVYGRALFRSLLRQFPGRSEICVVRGGGRAYAAALLLHGRGVSEVPSASSLRRYNNTNANMFLYWNMLERSVQRGQTRFDFGRSTQGGNTYRFKEQWGAVAAPTAWQYYIRSGDAAELRPENPRYQRLIHAWQRLPVWLTRLVGPSIVRRDPLNWLHPDRGSWLPERLTEAWLRSAWLIV